MLFVKRILNVANDDRGFPDATLTQKNYFILEFAAAATAAAASGGVVAVVKGSHECERDGSGRER